MFIQRETHLLYEGLYSSNPINVFHLVVKQLNTFAYCTIAIEWLNCLHKCILNKQIFWARLTDGKQKRWARFTVKYADLSQTTSEQPQCRCRCRAGQKTQAYWQQVDTDPRVNAKRTQCSLYGSVLVLGCVRSVFGIRLETV